MKNKSYWRSFYPIYLCTAVLTIMISVIGSRSVTALVESKPIDRAQIFVIDAGHGGIDGGATSCTGVLESKLNLDIALRLNDLMHLLGMETVMIRLSDISVHTSGETIAAKKVSDLKERVRIVNETQNAILISIHQNTFSDSKYSGAQVFYADNAESAHLAKILQSQLSATINLGNNRRAKKAEGIFLLENTNCTSLLLECGFLSNAEEEAKLRSEFYQKALCCVIASTLSCNFSETF